jgi:PAS domain-containing protein
MQDEERPKAQLLEELTVLRQRIAELETEKVKNQRLVEAWRDLWAQYEAMIEAFDGLIYICSENYEVEFMNQRFIDRTGYYPLGQKCYRVLHELEDVCPWCVNERVFKGEKITWEVLSPKDHHWYRIANTLIQHPDGSKSKMAMIQDITEFKEAGGAQKQPRDSYSA